MKGATMTRALALAFAGVALAATAAPASATPVCRELTLGTQLVLRVCADADAGVSGTTVTPVVTASCASDVFALRACDDLSGGSFGTYGFVPDPSFPTPVVDPATGSVKVSGGTVGTLYLGSLLAPIPVVVPPFCVGDPTFCHS